MQLGSTGGRGHMTPCRSVSSAPPSPSLLLPYLGWYLGQERGDGVLTVGILGSLSVDRRPQPVARERPRKGKV